MLANRLSGWLRPLLTLAALAGVLSLAACGGGNGAPNNPYQPGAGPLTVTPATGTGYSGVPFTFSVTGGTAPYSVISSDSVILPVTSGISGNSLVVVPGNVTAATPVSFTVSDAAGHQATGSLTVNPALVLPASITITGNPNCTASGATLCSGQDGSASVKVTGPGGAGLAGRAVRFDVVQGDFTISPPGQASVQTLTVTTDQNGDATVRLLVSVTAPTQIASIRVTDVTSGSNVLGQFTIAQYVNGDSVLSVIPSGKTTFTGPNEAQCNAGGKASFYIFGGTPPYTVAANFPQALAIAGAPVTRSGGAFTVTTTGLCVTNLTFIITDATGRVMLNPPTIDNVVGTGTAPSPDVVLTPNVYPATGTVACVAGSQVTQIIATGGTGTFTAAVSPHASATGGPLNAGVSGAQITVSVGALDAHGDWDINVSSGSSISTATIHCSP
jgi:hypothetical protein